MHAATVDLMTKKARFESDTALAVAEAFDIAIQQAQLVTVSMLDVRLADFRSYVDERFTRIDARFVGSEAKLDTRFAETEARVDARFAAFEAKLDARFAETEARVEARFAAFEAKLEVRFVEQDKNMLAQFATAKSENNARFDRIDARFGVHDALFDKKLAALRAELVRWVFVVMLGNAAISAAVNALMNSFLHLR